MIRGLGIPNVVLLQHKELIPIERGRFSEQVPEDEFQAGGVAAREALRDVQLNPPLAQHVLNPVHDVR
jgi:hypothetical protein